MPDCHHCGHDVSWSARFCPNCGETEPTKYAYHIHSETPSTPAGDGLIVFIGWVFKYGIAFVVVWLIALFVVAALWNEATMAPRIGFFSLVTTLAAGACALFIVVELHRTPEREKQKNASDFGAFIFKALSAIGVVYLSYVVIRHVAGV